VSRRHSRASSLDRREMFGKYIPEDNRHAPTIQPFQAHRQRDARAPRLYCSFLFLVLNNLFPKCYNICKSHCP
jgi:hypothetical protein